MTIAIIVPDYDTAPLAREIALLEPEVSVRIWPDDRLDDARLAVLWQQPPGVLGGSPKLRAVMSFGAGVDSIVADPTLPDVPIGRLVGPNLALHITRYVLAVVLRHSRHFDRYASHQLERRWQPESTHAKPVIGVLGLGEIGRRVATTLLDLGLAVHGWRAREKPLDGVEIHVGLTQLDHCLRQADFLVNTLPHTPATENLLTAERFAACKPGCHFINVGRGATVVDQALLDALDAGQLAAATLDVFRQEPLADTHPFWSHSKVNVTPHIAALTDPIDAAQQIVNSYRRVIAGAGPLHQVDRRRHY